ncbi:hypothetical protein HQ533_06250 [Candidatus Woesearchaeota archaeon]|nr:hypothetical protein [Candidatus Woesearchaeota archaeon]
MASDIVLDLIVSIVCFLGLFVGLLIGYFAKEELKPGRKYLVILQKIMFILVVFFIFYEFGFWLLGLLFLVFFSLILFQMKKDYSKMMYFFSAVFLFISFYTMSSIIPALVFFYSFPTGSLFLLESKEKKCLSLISGLFAKYYFFLVILIIFLLLKLIL